jgi:Tfp pilus assembly protein PilF
LWLRALSIKEKILGVRHPEIATTLTNLGVLAHAQGHHAEAQELFKRALALLEGLVTADHPVWRAAEDNLATTRRQSLTSSPRSP